MLQFYINLGNNDLGFLLLQNNRAKSIETNFGAANFSYSPTKALDISGFAIFSSTLTDLEQNSLTVYNEPIPIPNTGNFIEEEATTSNTSQRSNLGLLKLSAKYQPNVNNQLDYDVIGRISEESQDQRFFSSVNGDIDQLEETSPYRINQNLNYYYTLNESNIFALEAQHLIQDEDPFYNAIIEDKDNYALTAASLGLNTQQSNFSIAQQKRVKSNQFDAKLDYWNVLNTKSNLNLTLGTILSNQTFNSSKIA